MFGAKEQAIQKMKDDCFNAGLSEQKTEQCVDYFKRRLTHKEMAAKYNITAESSANRKRRLKKFCNDNSIII